MNREQASSISDETRWSRKMSWIRTFLWGLAFCVSIGLYFDPIDHYVPAKRSERRTVPVALAQQSRAAEIEQEVQDLVQTMNRLWPEKFPNNPMGELNGPASDEQIAELEHRFGPLPLDFKAFLKLHNGLYYEHDLFGHETFLDCAEIIDRSDELLSIVMEYEGFLPLTHDGILFHPGVLIFADGDCSKYMLNATNGLVYVWDPPGNLLTVEWASFIAILHRMVGELKDDDRQFQAEADTD